MNAVARFDVQHRLDERRECAVELRGDKLMTLRRCWRDCRHPPRRPFRRNSQFRFGTKDLRCTRHPIGGNRALVLATCLFLLACDEVDAVASDGALDLRTPAATHRARQLAALGLEREHLLQGRPKYVKRDQPLAHRRRIGLRSAELRSQQNQNGTGEAHDGKSRL